MPNQMEPTQKLIKDSGIMKLFDEFIAGTIPQTTFAKSLHQTANGMLESLQELEQKGLDWEGLDGEGEGKKRKKRGRRKKK